MIKFKVNILNKNTLYWKTVDASEKGIENMIKELFNGNIVELEISQKG